MDFIPIWPIGVRFSLVSPDAPEKASFIADLVSRMQRGAAMPDVSAFGCEENGDIFAAALNRTTNIE